MESINDIAVCCLLDEYSRDLSGRKARAQAAQIPNVIIDELVTSTDVAIFGNYCVIVWQTTSEGEHWDQGDAMILHTSQKGDCIVLLCLPKGTS